MKLEFINTQKNSLIFRFRKLLSINGVFLFQTLKVNILNGILAIILKETVAECKGLSCEEIEQCIEGEVSIENIPVNPTELITGDSQEDFLPGEGMVRYDIRTYLRLPGMSAPELSKILIDVEAQKDETVLKSIP